MFGDFDDDNDVRVPDDALARARTAGATRVRRRYAIAGGVALALLVAASIPVLSRDKPRTDVTSVDEPTTALAETTLAVDSPLSTTQGGAPAVVTTPAADTSPLFARIAEGGDLVVSHFDGSNRHVVLNDASGFAISPHHTRVLVASSKQIAVYDGLSGRLSTVATLSSSDHASWAQRPWSPDDSRVTFTIGSESRVYDVSTRQSRTIESEGTWSPDSKLIAFSPRDNDSAKLFVASPAGGDARAIATDIGAWEWSPDSKSIAYGAYYGTSFGQPMEPKSDGPLHIVRADGSENRTFATATRGSKTVVRDLSWSPDGRSLLTEKRIFRNDPTTTCPCSVGGDPSIEVLDVASGTWRTFEGTLIAWSNTSTGAITSDGRLPSPRVAVQIPWTTDSAAVFLDDGSGFYVQPIDGSPGLRVTSANEYWLPSPDRGVVAFKTAQDRRVVDVATHAEEAIPATWESVDDWFDWAPDSSVFFVRDPATKDFVVIGRDGAIKWRFHD